MKVSFFNRKLLKLYASIIAVISTIISFIQIFYEIPDNCEIKKIVAICFAFVLILIYIIVLIYSNKRKVAHLEINKTTINIIMGDIFKKKGLKVISFNEYFDTVVDDKIIASNTLHGQYILKYIDDITILDAKINEDKRLRNYRL